MGRKELSVSAFNPNLMVCGVWVWRCVDVGVAVFKFLCIEKNIDL